MVISRFSTSNLEFGLGGLVKHFSSNDIMKVTVTTFFVLFAAIALLLSSSSDAMSLGGMMGGGGGNGISEILVAGLIAKLLSEHHRGGCHS
ncbi:hypothetical protein AVEN_167168-1 [Araneus ventricosus]|uniref:Uncharacterized protein n=1 Tax=Araneus ventricosus TaxID=182803 RepID=A0A4Y2G1V0_ARAVE|nr:hypothetical protein AVEN_167168-1 [Araneus ventricosus]